MIFFKNVYNGEKMKKLINLVDDEWNSLTNMVVFGFGRQGKKVLNTLKKDFTIRAIV